jgi:hypothetical protein
LQLCPLLVGVAFRARRTTLSKGQNLRPVVAEFHGRSFPHNSQLDSALLSTPSAESNASYCRDIVKPSTSEDVAKVAAARNFHSPSLTDQKAVACKAHGAEGGTTEGKIKSKDVPQEQPKMTSVCEANGVDSATEESTSTSEKTPQKQPKVTVACEVNEAEDTTGEGNSMSKEAAQKQSKGTAVCEVNGADNTTGEDTSASKEQLENELTVIEVCEAHGAEDTTEEGKSASLEALEKQTGEMEACEAHEAEDTTAEGNSASLEALEKQTREMEACEADEAEDTTEEGNSASIEAPEKQSKEIEACEAHGSEDTTEEGTSASTEALDNQHITIEACEAHAAEDTTEEGKSASKEAPEKQSKEIEACEAHGSEDTTEEGTSASTEALEKQPKEIEACEAHGAEDTTEEGKSASLEALEKQTGEMEACEAHGAGDTTEEGNSASMEALEKQPIVTEVCEAHGAEDTTEEGNSAITEALEKQPIEMEACEAHEAEGTAEEGNSASIEALDNQHIKIEACEAHGAEDTTEEGKSASKEAPKKQSKEIEAREAHGAELATEEGKSASKEAPQKQPKVINTTDVAERGLLPPIVSAQSLRHTGLADKMALPLALQHESGTVDSEGHDDDNDVHSAGRGCNHRQSTGRGAANNPYSVMPDPMLAWKAAVLRALRGAQDGAMTVTALAALVPNPEPGSSYVAHLQAYLVDRALTQWLVQDESIQALPLTLRPASSTMPAVSELVEEAPEAAAESGHQGAVHAVPPLGSENPFNNSPQFVNSNTHVDKTVTADNKDGARGGQNVSKSTRFSTVDGVMKVVAEVVDDDDDDDEVLPIGPRFIDSKKSATMSKARNRGQMTDDEAQELVALMDSCDHDDDNDVHSTDSGHTHRLSTGRGVANNAYSVMPDPMLAWKAAVLRTLRSTQDGAMTVTSLAALVPNPEPGSSYAAYLQTHLVDRELAKWVVQNESIQLTSV